MVNGAIWIRASSCAQCGHVTVPVRNSCPRCGCTQMHDVGVGQKGDLKSLVELNVSTAEYAAPYFIGFVELKEGPRVLTRLEGTCHVGDVVHLKSATDEDLFWFASADTNSGET